jgi:uncharacterized protein YecE (DUF72 family)
MGCFLFQLPPSFYYTPARLKSILSQLEHKRRNVVEFRHASWWNPVVFTSFREAGTIFCSCSSPNLPDQLVKTAEDIYIRFHGVRQWYRHNYSAEELAVWNERIRTSGANGIWPYFNNDREGNATKNARIFLRQNAGQSDIASLSLGLSASRRRDDRTEKLVTSENDAHSIDKIAPSARL